MNMEKFNNALRSYIDICNETDWLRVQEAYKFRFGRWLNEKVKLDTQTDEEILNICIASQAEKFDAISKGVNFLLSALRFQGEFIQLRDIQIIKQLYNQVTPSKELFKEISISLPKFSAWLSTLAPERFNACPNEDLTESIAWLFDLDKVQKRGFNSFIQVQDLLHIVRQGISSNLDSIKPIVENSLGFKDIKPIDEVWLVQDFILHIHRNIVHMGKIFTWVPFFKELAQKLNYFKDDHFALIEVLKKSGITEGLNDRDIHDKTIELDDIDPFTFFSFIMKYGEQKRFEYLKLIKDELNIESAIPSDFSGVPSTEPRNVWLFRYKKDRGPNDIGELWELFDQALSANITFEQFSTVLEIKQVGKSKLTQNLFRVDPDNYFPIDTQTIPYLEKRGINCTFKNLDEYLQIVEEVKIKLNKPLYEVSHDAWFENQQEGVSTKEGQAEIQTSEKNKYPLNQILYGPPGTGKTYQTVNYALAIIEDKSVQEINLEEKNNENGRDRILGRFREYMNRGQIQFITFHQSFSYEDFIEGIKPVINDVEQESTPENISYTIEPGVFLRICEQARSYMDYLDQKQDKVIIPDKILNKANFYKMSLGDTQISEDIAIYDYCIENGCVALGYGGSIDYENTKNREEITKLFRTSYPTLTEFNVFAIERFKDWMKKDDIVLISYGNKLLRAVGIIEGDYYYDSNAAIPYPHFRKVRWIGKDLKIPVEEVYEKNFSQQTIYQMYNDQIKKEIFRSGLEKDIQKKKNHVLIIDEINRGNISKVFGELITLIEENKRMGHSEALEVILPYSKEKFSVPSNLYLLGTMNTADRSIALLDSALRRRFHFIELMPEISLVEENFHDLNLQNLLSVMNERIEFLLDRDHTLGHSYFLNIKSLNDLCRVFKNNIIPLLQEYFYNDWYKIQLVLGDNKNWGKLKEHKLVLEEKTYGAPDEKELFGLDLEDYEEVTCYKLNEALSKEEYDNIPPESFLYIYTKPPKRE